jgi:elongation factor Ts
MANISMGDVKRLRESTGAGMLDCKKALEESAGDYDKAVEYLRVKGLKGVAKREGRTATNGLVAAKLDGTTAAVLLELNCETDFVAKGDKFIQVADRVLEHLAAGSAQDVPEFLETHIEPGKTVQQYLDEANALLGEKVELRRFARVSGEHVAVYLHRTSPDLPPQVGVVVAFDGVSAETAKDVAQHIAAFSPKYLNRDDVPEDVVANERRIAEETAREEGKPEAALPKIVEGRVNGFFKENVLVDQAFARDQKKSVAGILSEAGVGVLAFARFRVGN